MDYASVSGSVSSGAVTGEDGKRASTEDPKSGNANGGGHISWAATDGGLLRYSRRRYPIFYISPIASLGRSLNRPGMGSVCEHIPTLPTDDIHPHASIINSVVLAHSDSADTMAPILDPLVPVEEESDFTVDECVLDSGERLASELRISTDGHKAINNKLRGKLDDARYRVYLVARSVLINRTSCGSTSVHLSA